LKISIIIPAYNEEKTIQEVIKRVLKIRLGKIKKEVIVVNDGSTDGTEREIKKIKDKRIKIISYKKNLGKGFAIRRGLREATGDIIIIQDADLELYPEEIPKLIKPIVEGKTKVVYGSRNLNKKNEFGDFLFTFGGKIVTFFANLLYGINITDEPCGYKVFKSEVIKKIPLKCRGFEFCPEITAKIAKRKFKIIEVPVKYNYRSRKEGKKLGAWDGIEALWILLKYRFSN